MLHCQKVGHTSKSTWRWEFFFSSMWSKIPFIIPSHASGRPLSQYNLGASRRKAYSPHLQTHPGSFTEQKNNTSLTCGGDMGPGTKHPSRDLGIGLARNEFILMSKNISQLGMVTHISTWGEPAGGARGDLVSKTSPLQAITYEDFSGLTESVAS